MAKKFGLLTPGPGYDLILLQNGLRKSTAFTSLMVILQFSWGHILHDFCKTSQIREKGDLGNTVLLLFFMLK